MDDEARETVRGFKKGSTQVPASAEDMASGAFKQACLSKWANNIVGNDILGKEVTRQQVKAVVKMGWRLTWKEQEGKPRKPKARFFGKGFTDHRKVDTYVGTPPLWVICTMILFCVSQGYEIDTADVTAAFLTSRDHNVERIGALIPESIPDLPAKCPFPDVTQKEWEERRRKAAQFKPGKIYLVEMGLYGLPCTAALFDTKLLSVMTELGFQRLETGLAVKKDDRGSTTATLLGEKRPAKIRALTSKDVELEEGEEGDDHWEGPLRAALGTLQWAVCLNPLRTIWASVAAKSVSKPSRKVFKGVVRLIDMLKARKEGRWFSSVGDTPHIHCFTDCGRHAATYTGRMGWLVRILPGPQGVKVGEDLFENWVLWHTARTTKKISSGTAGELMAVESCVKKVGRLIALVGKLWNCQPPVFIHIDCGPVYDQMHSGMADSDHTMQGCLDFCIQEQKAMGATLWWIPRNLQIANVLTKCTWWGQELS
uniref:Reverse transcriptase Ty1/copia-type domain-containing protein n=1 Tax=Chromera velia CCMP2878 TaxID=1169474 RepID=A0A0G4HFV4_9ALVE|eukprot:Cvel_27193.t1-p1 / transcript=Cvel_27193.t1 / gene=Cvel_27193 / organism=Chromera_velia_CCMP2878 / gene_product=hypothetical protein / transcript_product=hypothetical protein / location=Cvel_scaffold3358:2170-3840(-) / protein_length=482 / sequence_SO=supercontig / SO=protein_coding / is_pseudo=false